MTWWPSSNPSAAPPPSAEYQPKDPSRALELLLKRHEASSVHHSLATARGNATHVSTAELIRALSEEEVYRRFVQQQQQQ